MLGNSLNLENHWARDRFWWLHWCWTRLYCNYLKVKHTETFQQPLAAQEHGSHGRQARLIKAGQGSPSLNWDGQGGVCFQICQYVCLLVFVAPSWLLSRDVALSDLSSERRTGERKKRNKILTESSIGLPALTKQVHRTDCAQICYLQYMFRTSIVSKRTELQSSIKTRLISSWMVLLQ